MLFPHPGLAILLMGPLVKTNKQTNKPQTKWNQANKMQSRFCWQQSTAQSDASCTSNTDFTKKQSETSTTSTTETRVGCSNAHIFFLGMGNHIFAKIKRWQVQSSKEKHQKNNTTTRSYRITRYTYPPTPTPTTKSERGQRTKKEEEEEAESQHNFVGKWSVQNGVCWC